MGYLRYKEKYAEETERKKSIIARRILVFGIATSILFLIVTFGMMLV